MFNILEKQESLYLFAVNSFLVFNSFFFLFFLLPLLTHIQSPDHAVMSMS